MKTVRTILITAIAVLLAVSCAKSELSSVGSLKPEKEMTFGVSAAEAAGSVRSYLDGTTIKWSAGDKISVFSLDNESSTKKVSAVEFTLEKGVGESERQFSGTITESTVGYVALVPKTSGDYYTPGGNSDNPNSVVSKILSDQSPVEGGFDPKAVKMIGYSDPSSCEMSLFNLCGFFKLTLNDFSEHTISEIYLQTYVKAGNKDDEVGGYYLSGSFRVDLSSLPDAAPSNMKNAKLNYIRMLPDSGSYIEAGTYYLCARYNGASASEMYLILNDNVNNKYALLHGGAFTVVRNEVLTLPAISPDDLVWYDQNEVSVSKFVSCTATCVENSNEVSIVGSLESYPTNPLDDLKWKIQAKASDGDWEDTDLSGTGVNISGTITSLVSFKEYSLRVYSNGKIFSFGTVVPGAKIIEWHSETDGNSFGLQNENGTETYSDPITIAGYTWTFNGKFWFQSKKICMGSGTGTIKFPIIEGYRLLKVQVDNQNDSSKKTYKIVNYDTAEIYYTVEKVASGDYATFKLDGDKVAPSLLVPSQGRIKNMVLTYIPK